MTGRKFKRYHLAIVDILKEKEDLEYEQATLDEHDDRVTDLFGRLVLLVGPEEREVKVRIHPQQHLRRRLQYTEQNLRKVTAAVLSAAEQPNADRSWLEQYDEQVNGFKLKVFDISDNIPSLVTGVSELTDYAASMSQVIFNP